MAFDATNPPPLAIGEHLSSYVVIDRAPRKPFEAPRRFIWRGGCEIEVQEFWHYVDPAKRDASIVFPNTPTWMQVLEACEKWEPAKAH